MLNDRILIFNGNSNLNLSYKINKILNINPGKSIISKYSDGEIMIEIKENVRGKNIFVLQSICFPSNDNLIELLILIDALKKASVNKIIAIIPYLGYSRQDKKNFLTRNSISIKLFANILEIIGINNLITIDLHSDQIQGFFNIPIENIPIISIIYKHILNKKYKNLTIVSPDAGCIKKSRILSKKLNCNLAIIDKYRPKYNISESINIIGNVNKCNCIIIDDIIDTAGTITEAAKILKNNGAKKIIAYCTHPVLSGDSLIKIKNSYLNKLYVFDTIPIFYKNKICNKIKILSCSNFLAKIIKKVNNNKSIISFLKKI